MVGHLAVLKTDRNGYSHVELVTCSYASDAMRPRFQTSQVEKTKFQTRLYLPSNCPVRQVQGSVHLAKGTAQASACLEGIRQLHQVLPHGCHTS